MPAEVERAREMGQFEATLTGFGKQLEDMRRESRLAQDRAEARATEFFDAQRAQQKDIETVNSSVKVLAETVKNESELTRERFAAVWRWIAPVGGFGAVAGALVWVSKLAGGS